MPSTIGNMLLFFFPAMVVLPGELGQELPDVHTDGFPVTLIIVNLKESEIKKYSSKQNKQFIRLTNLL